MMRGIGAIVLGVILFAGMAISVWFLGDLVLSGRWPPFQADSASLNDAGVFGDSFGVLTSLFSGLAFAGIILTMLLQRSELKLQREELASHHETTKLQNFENAFFQMLRLHNDLVSSIDLLKDGRPVATGRDCFNSFYTRLTKEYRSRKKDLQNQKDDSEILQIAYKNFWKDQQTELGHYYRYLYNLIRFVDNSEFSDGPYITLTRAQLSDQELLMLFYNCLSPQGAPFKKYVEKYSLLDNAPLIRLLDKGHEHRFDKSAYGA